MERNYKMERRQIFNPALDVHFASIGSFKDIAGNHCHDFFEIFLITQGEVVHCVNGSRQCLSEGSLVFIRPKDAHYCERKEKSDCKLINVAFTPELAMSILGQFGSGLGLDFLTHPDVPPCITIPASEMSLIINRIGRLNSMLQPDILEERFETRVLVAELLLYFIQLYHKNKDSQLPGWLQTLCGSMENRENLVVGCSRLFQLAGRTPEHVCRTFKKWLDLTPTEYVNHLRLNYAKNLLSNSDEAILDICLQSGFENLSHFYRCFKRQYGLTPRSFRNEMRKNLSF